MDYINSDALNYGFGLFETIRVTEKKPEFLKEHCYRILRSLKFFRIACEINENDLMVKALEYIKENSLENAVLKVYALCNKGEVVFEFSQRKIPSQYDNPDYKGKLFLSNIRKSSTSLILKHKTLNYLENALELKKADYYEFDEMLFLNDKDNITEGAKSNVFFVKDNILCTPDMSANLLAGIIRDKVISLARMQGIEINIGSFVLDDILEADEVFITNSLMRVMPISEFRSSEYTNANITKLITEKIEEEAYESRSSI